MQLFKTQTIYSIVLFVIIVISLILLPADQTVKSAQYTVAVESELIQKKEAPQFQTPVKKAYNIENNIYFARHKIETTSKKYKNLGTLKVSHFCGCRKCNGKYYGMPTASGTQMVEGRTVAVDARNPIVPLGTKLLINGKIYTAEDTGNLNAYGRQLDIYVKSHKKCYQLGVKSYQVKIVKE